MTRAARAAAAAGAVAFSLAHVGSPDTLFEGWAGPYPVRVIVRTPGVVPGLADIAVRITAAPERVRTVTVLPLRGGVPPAANPPADTARRVPGDSALYAAQLWLMGSGAYSVQVRVVGTAGDGVAIVPVNSLATRRLEMRTPMTAALVAVFLVPASVQSQVLQGFRFSTIDNSQRAGQAFSVTITAVNPSLQRVTGFNGVVNLKQIASFAEAQISPTQDEKADHAPHQHLQGLHD